MLPGFPKKGRLEVQQLGQEAFNEFYAHNAVWPVFPSGCSGQSP